MGLALPLAIDAAAALALSARRPAPAALSGQAAFLVSDGYLESTRGRGVFVTDMAAKLGSEGEDEADAVLGECIASCRELGMGYDDIERAMSRKIRRLMYDEATERGEVSAHIIDFEKLAGRAEKGA